jgi:DNA/RNA endonuclease G, NUC1
MSPAGNRWNQEAMAQSFSLANVVPQNRENNQRLWARIETSVRKIAMSYNDTYVVTGPIFSGQQLQTIGPTRVFVPTQLFKVVYVPSRQMAFAVWLDNVSTNRYDIRTIHELEQHRASVFRDSGESQRSATGRTERCLNPIRTMTTCSTSRATHSPSATAPHAWC